MVATLPNFVSGLSERNLDLKEPAEELASLVDNIALRNRCLQLLHSLLFSTRNTINVS